MGQILQVNDLHVYYGSIHAVKGVSFEVNEGEVVTLIGANGAGKSTVLNTVSGLLHPKHGSVVFEGKDLKGVPAHKIVEHGLAQVPEGRHVFLQMTVEDNLEMGAYTQPNSTIEAGIADESSNDDANGVQVLGVYDVPGENGQNMQAAVLTNGEEYAVVADIDGDGVADALGVDENHTQQIEEYEVYDISNECVQMSNFQNAVDYEQQQQEQETFVYNANDDLSEDYNNHADINYEA